MSAPPRQPREPDLALIPALLHYDAIVDWPARLDRELPFLVETFASGPSRRVLDLGCGTGEHLAALADEGFEAVGIEGEPARWEAARKRAPSGVEVLLGDLGAVEAMVRGQFGGALCLGGTLPALLGAESLARMLIGLRRRLRSGGVLVAHQPSFDRLPRPGAARFEDRIHRRDDRVLVFRRELEIREDGVVRVTETVWPGDPEAPGAAPVHRRQLAHQGWRADELRVLLDTAQFRDVRLFGGFSGEPFDPATSRELVLVAR